MVVRWHVVLLGVLFSASLTAKAESIEAVADSFPPFVFLDKQKKPQGFSWQLLRHLFIQAGVPPPRIRFMAWPRVLRTLTDSKLAVVVAINRTAEREHQFLWIGPFYDESTYLYRIETVPIQINDRHQLPLYRYGVKRGASDERNLLDAGVPSTQIDGVDNDLQNLDKLWRRRVDLVPFLPLEMNYYTKFYPQDSARLVPAYELSNRTPLSFAFNLAFDPVLYERLLASFELAKDRGVLINLAQLNYPKTHDIP